MWHVLRRGEERCMQGCGEKIQEWSQLVMPSHRWEGNIIMDL